MTVSVRPPWPAALQLRREDGPYAHGMAIPPRLLAFAAPPKFGVVVQDHIQQRIMNFQFSVIFDESQLPKFVHEGAHARPRGADHLGRSAMAEDAAKLARKRDLARRSVTVAGVARRRSQILALTARAARWTLRRRRPRAGCIQPANRKLPAACQP